LGKYETSSANDPHGLLRYLPNCVVKEMRFCSSHETSDLADAVQPSRWKTNRNEAPDSAHGPIWLRLFWLRFESGGINKNKADPSGEPMSFGSA
jgi:hypothetical protein